jgi:hypothetical protein
MTQLSRGRTVVLLALLAALTAVPAVIHGHIMNRWGLPADLQTAAARVQNFPQQIGDWKRVTDEELDKTVVEELKCAGYVNGRYFNQKTGKDVSLLLLAGPPGPLVRHPPEICYGNRANKLLKGPERYVLSADAADTNEFRVLRYRSPGSTRGEFSICYAWSDGTGWSVPDHPRTAFGGASRLYKLQIHSTDDLAEGKQLPASAEEFLSAFVQVARSGAL